MNKYHAKKVIIDGITFDSTKEGSFYKQLLLKEKAIEEKERVIDIELQPRFDYTIEYAANGRTMKTKAFYKADFKVTYGNGSVQIIDVKGFKTSIYKQKKKIIESLYKIQIIEK